MPGGSVPDLLQVPAPPVLSSVVEYGEKAVAGGSNGVVIVGRTRIRMLSAWLSLSRFPVWLKVTVKPKVPPVVGVPLMRPDELRLSPGGRDPAVIAQVPASPVFASCCA